MILRWRASRYDPLTWRLYFAGGRHLTDVLGIVEPQNDLCPYCWEEVDVEFVDVGFGGDRNHGIQATPMQCPRCEAYEVTKGGWVPGRPMVRVVPQLVGMVWVTSKAKPTFYRDNFRVVRVGTDPRAMRREIWLLVAEERAAAIEKELTK